MDDRQLPWWAKNPPLPYAWDLDRHKAVKANEVLIELINRSINSYMDEVETMLNWKSNLIFETMDLINKDRRR